MRIGTVVGRVTLSKGLEELRGARWLIVSPFARENFQKTDKEAAPVITKEASVVVYDNLGGDVRQTVGFIEGREAAMPFDTATPIDGIVAALVDTIFFSPFNTQ